MHDSPGVGCSGGCSSVQYVYYRPKRYCPVLVMRHEAVINVLSLPARPEPGNIFGGDSTFLNNAGTTALARAGVLDTSPPLNPGERVQAACQGCT